MMDNIVSLRPPEQPATLKRPYAAYGLAMATREALHISIYRQEGSIFQLDNAILSHALRLDEEAVGLVFNNCLIEVVGRNLDALPKLMDYYHPSFIEVFAPDFYLAPSDDAPFIEAIRWKTVMQADGRLLFPSFQYDSSLIVFK